MTISLILLLVGCILLHAEALTSRAVTPHPLARIRLGWLGMALWATSLLVGSFG